MLQKLTYFVLGLMYHLTMLLLGKRLINRIKGD
jgi:hypothetical protein